MIPLKKSVTKYLYIIIILSITLILSSCGNEPKSVSVNNDNKDENGMYPLTIKTYNYDKKAVDVIFEETPQKVYVMGQNNIEIMLTLGLGDKIIAGYGMDGKIADNLKSEFEKISYTNKGLPKEDVLKLQPDFILGWYSMFSDKNLGDVSFWHKRAINTYMSLNSSCRPKSEPHTVGYEIEDILNIGKIFDVEEKAQKIVDDMNREIDKINEYVKDVKKVSIAILEEEKNLYRVYGNNNLGGDIALKGGAKLAIGENNEETKINAEHLIEKNPDAIFMVWYDGYLSSDEVVYSIMNNPAFKSLDAVKNNMVFGLNLNNIYCSGLRTQNGILEFSEVLYPQLYKDN